jgi:hypothetical protein
MFIFMLSTLLAGIPSCIPTESPSGSYKIDTFEFVLSKPSKDVGEAIPNIWIDTNLKLSSLFGGTLKSSLPCSIKIDYTDNDAEFKNAEITSLRITYDDDTLVPSAKALALPLRIAAREYETVNSVAGGRIVKSKVWVISGSVPNAITFAAPFRLQLEGYFTKGDGSRIPFAMDQHFDVKTENTVKSAAEVLQDK